MSKSSGRYVYTTPWPAYAMAWAPRVDPAFRLAIGSCREHEKNVVQVVELNEDTKSLEVAAEVVHELPATKIMFKPTADLGAAKGQDTFASSTTTLNLWRMEDGQAKHILKLANTRMQAQNGGHLPPLTSFDWSPVNEHKIGASSVDTTCTIWNIEKQKIETQLIAHDKAVYDIAFSQVDSLFASVGADGSVRLFDQRNLDHSTIIYEASPPSPLLRLAWNKVDTNLIATMASDKIGVILIDVRRPSVALRELTHHESCVNHISWAPHSKHHLLCGTDDGHALIWDIREGAGGKAKEQTSRPGSPVAVDGRQVPVLAYDCDHEVYQTQWPGSQPEYIALGTATHVEVLQI